MFELKFRPSSHSDDWSNVGSYECQKLTITLMLPLDATEKTLPLLLTPTQYALYMRIQKICGQPKKKLLNNRQEWSFHYEGQTIFVKFFQSIIKNQQTDLPVSVARRQLVLEGEWYPADPIFHVAVERVYEKNL